jgi:hypothetical protein
MTRVCYLCGDLSGPKPSRDHVPPQQFYAPSLRRRLNLARLQTLPTHMECNEAFKKDEEYFVWALSPLAVETTAGKALLFDQTMKVRSGQRLGLAKRIRAEFEARPSGLILPDGKEVKRLDGERIRRVAWKVVRGLYMLETRQVLPKATKFTLEVLGPADSGPRRLTDFWDPVRRQPSKGPYQGIFAYKYLRAVAEDDPLGAPLHVWAMLLWDRLILYLLHLDVPLNVAESGE